MYSVSIRAGELEPESEPVVFGSLEPEPIEKKTGDGAGAGARAGAEPLKNYPAPQPCEKIKSIRKLYFSYSSLGKILSFIVKKKTIILLFYIFFGNFNLLVCVEKNI